MRACDCGRTSLAAASCVARVAVLRGGLTCSCSRSTPASGLAQRSCSPLPYTHTAQPSPPLMPPWPPSTPLLSQTEKSKTVTSTVVLTLLLLACIVSGRRQGPAWWRLVRVFTCLQQRLVPGSAHIAHASAGS